MLLNRKGSSSSGVSGGGFDGTGWSADGEKDHFSDYTLHSVRVAMTKPLLRLTRAIRYSRTKRPAYETSGLNRVTRANVQHQLSIRENALFAAAESNDVDLLESCVKAILARRPTRRGSSFDDDGVDGSVDGSLFASRDTLAPSTNRRNLPRCARGVSNFEDRTDLGGTAYHIALQHNNLEVASRLLMIYPEYVNMTYTGAMNEGQHPLHIAVVNHNLPLVKELVAFGAKIDEPRCTGQFFNPGSKHCQVYWGEHVLAFAVCLHQRDTVEYLIQQEADINKEDSKGNNIFHLLILQRDHKVSVNMYKYIVDFLAVGEQLEAKHNHDGLTPIQLAAKEANVEFFEELLRRRRHVHWTYGPITSCVYSLKGIDTFNDGASVLELLALNEKPASVELLRLSPIKDTLEAKWRQFGFFYFVLWLFIYLLNIIILTVVVRFRPVYCPRNASAVLDHGGDGMSVDFNLTFVVLSPSGQGVSDPTAADAVMTTSIADSCDLQCFPMAKRTIFGTGEAQAYRNSYDYARLGGEMLVILGVLVSLGYEIPDLRKRGWRKYFTNVGSGSFQALSWVYAFFIFLSVILRITESDNEEVTLAIAVVLGWLFILFFARGFAFLGPYISMIQTILRTDTLRFLVIFIVAIVSFSGVTHAVFNEARPLQPTEFFSYADTFVYLFRLAIGITEFSVSTYRSAPVPGWAVAFFCIYVVLGFLLLIQLLIAMMNATHQRVEKDREAVWEKQLASLILLLERRLPQRLKIRTGFPGQRYSLGSGPEDDRWFIRVVEHGTMSKITRVPHVPYTKQRRRAVRRKQHDPTSPAGSLLRGQRLHFAHNSLSPTAEAAEAAEAAAAASDATSPANATASHPPIPEIRTPPIPEIRTEPPSLARPADLGGGSLGAGGLAALVHEYV